MELHTITARLNQIGSTQTQSQREQYGFNQMIRELIPVIEAASTISHMTIMVSDHGSLFLDELSDEEQYTGAALALTRTQIIVNGYHDSLQ